jgi:hypothetical protein
MIDYGTWCTQQLYETLFCSSKEMDDTPRFFDISKSFQLVRPLFYSHPDARSQIPVTRPVALDISPLLINRHARLRSFLLHLGRRLLGAFQHSKDVLAGESSKIALRPASPLDELCKL